MACLLLLKNGAPFNYKDNLQIIIFRDQEIKHCSRTEVLSSIFCDSLQNKIYGVLIAGYSYSFPICI